MALSIYSSAALEDSAVVKASAGALQRLSVINTEPAARTIMIFNATSLPANATAPVYRFPIASSGSIDIDLAALFDQNDMDQGLNLDTGIVVANSTTQLTLTVSIGDDVLFDILYL